MKRADLVKGESYAFSTRQRIETGYSHAVEMILLDTRLFLQPRYPRNSRPVLAGPGRRPTHGDLTTSAVGLRAIGTHEDAHEQLVLPQNLHMRWADYLVWREAANAEAAGIAARKREQAARTKAKVQEIVGLLNELGLSVDRIYDWKNTQEISNDVLLQILRLTTDKLPKEEKA